MHWFKPLLRAVTNSLTVVIGLWGLVVTDDFVWLFAAVALIGIINLFVGVSEERRMREERARADQLQAMVQESRDYLRTVVGPLNTPPHLQDLTLLTNAQIKNVVDVTARGLREFASEVGEGHMIEPWWRMVPNAHSLPQEGQNALRDAEREQMHRSSEIRVDRFRKERRPGALALWTELKRRLGLNDVTPGVSRPVALDYGMLAGPAPIEEAATALEELARRLAE